MNCYNRLCPWRYSSSKNDALNCEHCACPNRDTREFTYATNRTILNGDKSSDSFEPLRMIFPAYGLKVQVTVPWVEIGEWFGSGWIFLR